MFVLPLFFEVSVGNVMKKLIQVRLIIVIFLILTARISDNAYAECAFCRTATGSMSWVSYSLDGYGCIPSCTYSYFEWGTTCGVFLPDGSWSWNQYACPIMVWVDALGYWDTYGSSSQYHACNTTVHDWWLALPVCPADPYEPPAPPITDTDEDGIDDPCDPYPDENNAGSMWLPVIEWSTGGMSFQSQDDPDRWIEIGDCSGTPMIIIGEEPIEFSDLLADCDPDNPYDISGSGGTPDFDIPLGGGDSGNATSTPQIPDYPIPSLPDSGGDSGNATATPKIPDTYSPDPQDPCCPAMEVTANNSQLLVEGQNDIRDYLAALQGSGSAIEANTGATAGNTAKLVLGQNDVRDYLAAIQESSGLTAGKASEITDLLRDANETVYDIEGEVTASLNTQNDLAETAASEGLENIDSQIAAREYTALNEDDVPDYSGEQQDYEDAVENVKTSTGLSSLQEDVGVSCSGEVSFLSCNVFGSDIFFDFSDWEYILDLIGIAFLSLCYISGLFMLMRK